MEEKIEKIAAVPLRKASKEDFAFEHKLGVGKWEKRRKIGMPYFLENSAGNLECYYVSEATNRYDLADFIREGRCYVLQQQKLGEGKMIEILKETRA